MDNRNMWTPQPYQGPSQPYQGPSQQNSMLESLYSGSATIGKISTTIGVVIFTPIFIFIIIYVNKSDATYTEKDPKGLETQKPISTGAKIAVSIFCAIMLLIMWGYLYAVYKVKAFAAYQGVNAIF
jgi:hypothetical protein